tara:strand:+ start:588 stop:1040 length:453 start_codon:yes stop_codon:yes gene_type:complete
MTIIEISLKMNIIDISGGSKHQRKLCNSVIKYMIKKLLPRHRTLQVNVELTNIQDDATGYCMIGDNNREFYIEIDKKLNIKDMVVAICHEMIHVKQYARKEISDWNGLDQPKWKNNLISKDCGYWDWPWEKEAYSLEYQFADECWEKNII